MSEITERDLAELHYILETEKVSAGDFEGAENAVRSILDINGDGEINDKDVKALKKMLAGEFDADEVLGDVNGDGKVNAKDVAALKAAIARLKGAK